MGRLLEQVRPFFATIALGVQDSNDATLRIATEFADTIVEDRAHGYGDATMPSLLEKVHTRWSFRIDGDELPTVELLASLGTAAAHAESQMVAGLWIRFRSWIDDIEWEAYHSHLRLFETQLGWPGTLHSRPHTSSTLAWETGWIEHRKTLDKHVRSYLGYLNVGRGHPSWDAHNSSMIWHACVGTAQVKGWDYVKAHDWWPEVEATIFKDGLPAQADPQP